MWICVEIEDCTGRTISFEAASVWGVKFFFPHSLLLLTSPPLISEEGTIIPPLPSPLLLSSFFCHVSLFTEKEKNKTKTNKPSSLFSPMHPEIHLPTPVYSLAITYQPSYLHFHLKKKKKSTVLYIYIMIIPDFFSFFYCECFCAAPLILFSSLLVALMWNVCAEPIECCVYIKATLFLTIPAFVWVWLHRTERKTKNETVTVATLLRKKQKQNFKQTLTCFNLCRELRLDREIRLNIMRVDHF